MNIVSKTFAAVKNALTKKSIKSEDQIIDESIAYAMSIVGQAVESGVLTDEDAIVDAFFLNAKIYKDHYAI